MSTMLENILGQESAMIQILKGKKNFFIDKYRSKYEDDDDDDDEDNDDDEKEYE